VWGAGVFVGSMLSVLLVVGMLSLSSRLGAARRGGRAVAAKDQSLPTHSSSSSDASDAEERPPASGPPVAREVNVQSSGGAKTSDVAAASPGARVVRHQAPPQQFARSPVGHALPKAMSPVYSPAVAQARSFALQQGCTLDLSPAPRGAPQPALRAAAQPQCGGPSAPDSTVTCLTPRSSTTRQTDCELGGATPVETRQEYR